MDTVRAITLTREAARRLRLALGSGHVHPAYDGAVNPALDGLDETGWLTTPDATHVAARLALGDSSGGDLLAGYLVARCAPDA